MNFIAIIIIPPIIIIIVIVIIIIWAFLRNLNFYTKLKLWSFQTIFGLVFIKKKKQTISRSFISLGILKKTTVV